MQSGENNVLTLSLLGVVCERERQASVLEVLEASRSYFSLSMLGRGTATSKILGYFGLGETAKHMFLCVMPAETARDVLNTLNEEMEFKKPGHGMAFLCAVSEGCYHRPVAFCRHTGGEMMEENELFDVVMVVLNCGFTEDVMHAARAAGATGGTVLHARGCGLAGAQKFFGVTIQPEKELLMIVAPRDISCGIMAEVAEKAGPESAAGSVSFSMPATAAVGLAGALPK